VADLTSGGDVFSTKVGKTFKLSEFAEAIDFSERHATDGKAIIHPQE